MQGKGEFNRSDQNLAMLGHELYSVLHGIQGMTELLSSTRLNGEQEQFVDAVKTSIEQMHWLIDGITLQGQDIGFPLSPKPCLMDGPELLEQAIRCHSRAAMMKNNLLLLLVEPQLPQFWFADAHLLRQIIDNLLTNAIKFTQAGKVVLEARPAPARYGIEAGLELSVRDTGIGFDQAVSRRIFEPFVQAGADIRREYGGRGLGLHICRRIVSCLNGRLDCISKPGSGSSFRMLVPDVIVPEHGEACSMNSRLFSSMSCKVSVEGDLAHSLASLLMRLGIQVQLLQNGEKRHKGVDFHVDISLAESDSQDTGTGCTLVFTPHQSMCSSFSGIKRLQPPFLASTLGPLLIEMKLEQKFNSHNHIQLPQ